MALSLDQMLKQRREKVDTEQAAGVRPGKIPAGDSNIRLLPSWRKDGDPTFFHEYGQHFIKEKGVTKAVYICTKNTHDRACAVCDAVFEGIAHAKSNPHLFDEDHVKMLEEARGSRRIVMNMIIRGQEGDKPQLVEMAKGTFDNDILPILEEYGDALLKTKGGQDLLVKRTGTGKNTRYNFQVASPKSNVPDIDESVLTELLDIDAWVKQESEAGAQRAIAAVSEVAGIAPPAKHVGGPKLSAPKADDDGLGGLLDDDVIDGEAEEVVEAKVVEAKATGTHGAVVESTSTDDLDAMLEDL